MKLGEAFNSSGKEEYALEALALRDRVRLGNEKLSQAFLQIKEIDGKEEWSRQMDRWSEVQQKLHALCDGLKLKGYNDCLYLENGKKVRSCLDNPDGFWWQVCPSVYPYWEAELMNLPSPKAPKRELMAELVALRTRRLLSSRGWCLWKCDVLGGEVIVVVRDEKVAGVPEGYPVYTEAELEKLFNEDINESTLRLIHEAKKHGGAVVTSVEDAKEKDKCLTENPGPKEKGESLT